jgi:hypothetical protein
MNFGERSEIKSLQKMVQFLESERIGRFATIDKNGFPIIAPMNFVFFNSCFYVHGFPKGEKYENIKTNAKCGFEVDKELAFLPSYFFESPTDASKTDTLYISIVVKGTAELESTMKNPTVLFPFPMYRTIIYYFTLHFRMLLAVGVKKHTLKSKILLSERISCSCMLLVCLLKDEDPFFLA